MGKSRVASKLSSKANTPTLAAVSPKRVNGPWTRANGKPWYRRGIPPSDHSFSSDDCKFPP
eukprot:scaffold3571_cov176-Amphora_coffeaeformis.AAC.25